MRNCLSKSFLPTLIGFCLSIEAVTCFAAGPATPPPAGTNANEAIVAARRMQRVLRDGSQQQAPAAGGSLQSSPATTASPAVNQAAPVAGAGPGPGAPVLEVSPPAAGLHPAFGRGHRLTPARRVDDGFVTARAQMVTNQLAAPGRGIVQRIVDAMAEVPRHQFVLSESLADSYEDKALEVGYGAALESPFAVASAAQQLDPKPSDRVLELGTGSGYQTAIISRLVKAVYSVEPVEQLATGAIVNYQRIGYTNNIFVRNGNLAEGWPEAGPFDAIVVNGKLDTIPVDQLKDGGRVIVGADKDGNQHVLKKAGGRLVEMAAHSVRVPPVTGNKVALPQRIAISKQE